MKKKVLIFTVTAGEGHNSIAKALKNCLESHEDVEYKVVDILKEFSTRLKCYIVNDGYLMACKYLRPLYNKVASRLQKRDPNKRDTSMAVKMVKKETPKIYQAILDYNPDAIICTHFYPATAITTIRKTHELKCPVAAILTDYWVHPGWESSIGIDYLITPSEGFVDELIYKGFNANQVVTMGLPVNPKFSVYKDKYEAREELSLSKDLFTVGTMMGGGGMGGVKKLLKNLLKVETPTQIMVICGKDKRTKKSIDNYIKKYKGIHKVICLGFVNNVDVIMSASDVFVGKGGCISINESLNKKLPLVLIDKLPEQEKQNMLYLTKHNAAMVISKKNNLTNIINKASVDKEFLSKIIDGINEIRKPNACEDIVNFILNKCENNVN